MKFYKILLFVSLVLSGTSALTGQWHVGVRGGAIISNNSTTEFLGDVLPMEWRTGPEFAFFAERRLTAKWSLISGFGYSRKGFSTNQEFNIDVTGFGLPVDLRVNTRLNYLETPIAIKYTISGGAIRPYAYAGALASYATGGSIQPVANTLFDINLPAFNIDFASSNLTRWNIAATMGAGVEWTTGKGKLFADIAYQHGLNDLVTDTFIDLDVKNRGVSVGVGYAHEF